jgi:hypothetical protein
MVKAERRTPSKCEVHGCENLPVFEYTGTIVNKDGTTGSRPCYLCIACASGLLTDGEHAEVKIDVEGQALVMRR